MKAREIQSNLTLLTQANHLFVITNSGSKIRPTPIPQRPTKLTLMQLYTVL
uniref:Uncharacterized protein n=1 Tax=Arundo donax TaxID=35708 RepID=A0A0A9HC20_ARUDO